MRYSLSVPERALPAVRSALGVFDRVQTQVLEPAPSRRGRRARRGGAGRSVEVVRAELRLARPSSEPLADLPLSPDPLQSFARVIARLDRTHGEQRRGRGRSPTDDPGDPQTSSPSATQAGRPPWRVIGGGAARTVGCWAILWRWPPGGPASRGRDGRAAGRAGGDRRRSCCSAEPLFGLPVLIRCSSPERGRAVECLQGLLGCFDGFAGSELPARCRRAIPGSRVRGIGSPWSPRLV